jgi:hypothetical protein
MDQARDPLAPFTRAYVGMAAGWLQRHGPISGPTQQVGTPEPARRSYGYAFASSPGIWSRGARNAVHRTSTAF